MIKKMASIFMLLAMLFVLTTGCSNKENLKPTSDAEIGENAKTEALTIAIHKDENSLTPYTYVTGTPGFDVMKFIYDSLFSISPENEVIPWMVEDNYEISGDFKTYLVTLKEGLKWHDGKELTAEDVKFTFTYVLEKEKGRWTGIAKKVESIEVKGKQITFTLKESDPDFLRSGLADMRIFAKHMYEGAEDPNVVENMGSGMYRLKEYKTGESYTLEAVEDYFRGTPKVKLIKMPIVTDLAVAQQGVIAGEFATFTSGIGAELMETFQKSETVEVIQSEGYGSNLLLFNCKRAPFDEAKFRKALSLAVDVNTLVEQVCLGFATPGTGGHIKKGMSEYTEGLEYVKDIETANKMLDELGYTKKNANGMRSGLDGKTMEFELLAPASNSKRIRSAEIIAKQMEEIGIQVKVVTLESDSLSEKVWPDFDATKDGDFEMAMWGWSGPTIQKAGAVVTIAHSDTSTYGGDNLSHYNSAVFDSIAEEYLASLDMEKRKVLSSDMQKILLEEVPFMTLYFEENLSGVNKNLYQDWVNAKGCYAFNPYSFLPKQ